MIKLQLLATTVLAISTVQALAADRGSPIAWTGVYAGLQAGYAWGDGGLVTADGYSNADPDGLLGGIYAGYDYQLSNGIVLGIEADIAWVDADDTALAYDNTGIPGGFPDNSFTQDINWIGAVRARVGYVSDRWLPYIAGGIAYADVDQIVVSGSTPYSFDDTVTGWTIGAGTQYALTGNLIGRFEYRYTDFGSNALLDPAPMDIDLTSHDLRLGIAYKF